MIHLHQFLKMMAAERGASRSTLSSYDADLRNFYTFLNNQRVDSVTPQNIQDYVLTQQSFSLATVERRLSCLRQFYTFLLMGEKINENPVSFVKATHYKPNPFSFMTKEHVDRLLKGAKAWGGAEGKRLAVLLQILCISPISVDHLVALSLKVGLDAQKGEKPLFFVQIKQNNDRLAQLTESTLESLREYMEVRHYFLTHDKESPWLFPSSSQKGHLTRQRVGQLLKELALKAGLNPAHTSLPIIRRGLGDYYSRTDAKH